MQDDALPRWMPPLAAHGGPRFLQIADALQAAVAQGTLQPGARLPPQRQLAAQLGVDLTTVTRAYDEAKRRHLLEGRGARGTYVAAPKVALTSAILDLSMNTPPPPQGVDLGELLQQGMAQVLRGADASLLMTYHLGGGSEAGRTAGAQWLAPMLGAVQAQEVLVCPSAQAAIAASMLALTQPGDVILAEPYSYPGLRAAALQLGRRVVAVLADAQGMQPDALEQACRQHRPALLYLNPTLHNPTALTMPQARRQALVRTAQRHRLRVLEDDPYWLLAESPPPPLAAWAPQVYYISTLSKCLTPGLRVAFVRIVDAHERARFVQALRALVLMVAPLTAAVAAQWILDGSAYELMEGVRKEARQRHWMARDILAGRYSGAGDGLHAWLPLPSYWSPLQLARAANAEGMAVTPAQAFATGGSEAHDAGEARGACDAGEAGAGGGLDIHAGPHAGTNAIRISLGCEPDRARLQAGLQQLSHLLARQPDAFHTAVV